MIWLYVDEVASQSKAGMAPAERSLPYLGPSLQDRAKGIHGPCIKAACTDPMDLTVRNGTSFRTFKHKDVEINGALSVAGYDRPIASISGAPHAKAWASKDFRVAAP